MDSEHRHELQQNDLAEFIANFKEWWQEHGMRTLLTILVIVAVASLWVSHKSSVKAAHDRAWGDLYQATSPEALRNVADSHDDVGIRLMARLRAGDLALSQVVLPDSARSGQVAEVDLPETENQLTDQQRQQLIDTAQEDYQAVLEHPGAADVMKLNALLGLASVAEMRGSWDEARSRYDAAIEIAGNRYQRIAAVAEARAAAIDRIARPVIFAPELEPEPQADTDAESLIEAAREYDDEDQQAPDHGPTDTDAE